jgi:hypothetical protein
MDFKHPMAAMKSYSTLGLFLISSSAFADCEKIDYVEVKDWPVVKVEQALCDSREESYKLTMMRMRLEDSEVAPRNWTVG